MLEINSVPRDPHNWVVSPTQIDKFDDEREGCQRKWAWEYIRGMRGPQNSSAALGEGVHKILEKYLLTGEQPDQSTREGEIATAGLHLLPAPGFAVVEQKVGFTSPAGYLYTGRVDFQYTYDHLWESDTQPPWKGFLTVIGDHKTTGDFKWIKTPDKLAHDTQALVYAANSLLESGDPAVMLRWIYYRTRGSPKAEESSLILTAEQVEERFQRIDKVTEKIHLTLLNTTDPLEVPANTDACERFGGCPYRPNCNISLGERFSSYIMSNLPPVPPPFQPPGSPGGIPNTPVAGVPAVDAALLARLQAQAAQPAAPPSPPNMLEQMRIAQAAAIAAVHAPPPQPPPPAALPGLAPGVPTPPPEHPAYAVAAAGLPVTAWGGASPQLPPGYAAPTPMQEAPSPTASAANMPPWQAPQTPPQGWPGVPQMPVAPPVGAPIVVVDPPASEYVMTTRVAAPAPLPTMQYQAPVPSPTTWYEAPHVGLTYSCVCGQQITVPVVTHNRGTCPNCKQRVHGAEIACGQTWPAINPPEGQNAVPPAPLAAPAGPPPNPAPEPAGRKGGPGRPAGSKNKPKDGETPSNGGDVPQSATWAKEKISPRAYNDLEIGPFTLSEYPREGETSAQCLVRLIGEVNAIGEAERARKIQSYMASLPPA